MPGPSVSVIIPCFNAAPFLGEAIRSALDQSLPPVEVIVVDDGSTDDSAEIAQSFGPPVRVLRQENHGESVARNRGIDEAAGDWVALLDADDVWLPSKLRQQWELVEADPSGDEVVCIGTRCFAFAEDGRQSEFPQPDTFDLPEPSLELLVECAISPSAAMFRRRDGLACGFPEETRSSEDMIFFAHLRTRGRFLRVDDPLTGYRRSDAQQTKTPGHLARSIRCRYEWAERHPDVIPPARLPHLRSRLLDEVATFIRRSEALDDLVSASELRTIALELDPEHDSGSRPTGWRKWAIRADAHDAVRRGSRRNGPASLFYRIMRRLAEIGQPR
ncbi:glycosyltransferase family 2 protein [Stratiformator vulcanicus]|uniref:Putative glycosyltransferase EpsJ n=1 Tax=Stratiformator vulcanicus TaxID=2527980 RepID=A0A517R7M8_9PLAN|nr:glycosyltransferase family 2 protein [Stratiformator vulcanicus]QDT39894.1 putative glycosyltransferase EpsJ [Stratiformator vulcanicus]